LIVVRFRSGEDDVNTKLSTRRDYKRNLVTILLILTILGLLFVPASCRQIPTASRTLEKGDKLNGMVLTSGTIDAPPLEAFCIFDIDEEVTTTIDCQVPPLPKLAIGHMIGVTGRAFQELDWSKIDWQIYLDGYLLDLDTFDEQSYVEPEIGTSPSLIREVFKQRKTWDIVLINPTFGLHTLVCTAKTNSVVYKWVVNFEIMSTPSLIMTQQLPNRQKGGPD
jgi:hypothetical protein